MTKSHIDEILSRAILIPPDRRVIRLRIFVLGIVVGFLVAMVLVSLTANRHGAQPCL